MLNLPSFQRNDEMSSNGNQYTQNFQMEQVKSYELYFPDGNIDFILKRNRKLIDLLKQDSKKRKNKFVQNFIQNSNLNFTKYKQKLSEIAEPKNNRRSFFLANQHKKSNLDKAAIKQQVLNIQKQKQSKINSCLKFFKQCIYLQQMFISRIFKHQKKKEVQVASEKVIFSKNVINQ
eukprot:TRINITY_DN38086_c0_g1_i1.p2 TRINITY_DN38086_c0_g1~~TRINITY_DN38086_c0_g1_i1.p2  ORF type:complete len:176 (-),score=19.06 TRINITY_DN38086_c0_g1_i1:10-537(-)